MGLLAAHPERRHNERFLTGTPYPLFATSMLLRTAHFEQVLTVELLVIRVVSGPEREHRFACRRVHRSNDAGA